MAAALDAFVRESVAGVDRPDLRGRYHRGDACNTDFVQFVLDMMKEFKGKKRAFIIAALTNCIRERTARNEAFKARKRDATAEELAEDEKHERVIKMFTDLLTDFNTIHSAKLPKYRFYYKLDKEGKPSIGIYPKIAPEDIQGVARDFVDPSNAVAAPAAAATSASNAAAAPAGWYGVLDEETSKDRKAREAREKAMKAYEAKLATFNSDEKVAARKRDWDTKLENAKRADAQSGNTEATTRFFTNNGESFDKDKGAPKPPAEGGRRHTRRKNGRRRTQKKRKTYV
jgi:hypothetical protein